MPTYEGFADLETKGWSDDGISSGYVNLFAAASDMAIMPIIESIKDTGRVLDLCCGQGNVSEALVGAGHAVVGADFSDKMLDHARQRLPDGRSPEASVAPNLIGVKTRPRCVLSTSRRRMSRWVSGGWIWRNLTQARGLSKSNWPFTARMEP